MDDELELSSPNVLEITYSDVSDDEDIRVDLHISMIIRTAFANVLPNEARLELLSPILFQHMELKLLSLIMLLLKNQQKCPEHSDLRERVHGDEEQQER